MKVLQLTSIAFLLLVKVVFSQTEIILSPTDDAYIYSGGTDGGPGGVGGIEKLKVGYYSTFGTYRTVLKFDLSEIPQNANIISANLRLWHWVTLGSGNNAMVDLYRMTNNWNQDNVHWNILNDKYDFIHFEENVRARQLAYEEAGITDPRKQLDLAEMHDCFTITELITAEDLLFSERGTAGKDYADGVFTAPDGELPLNTDGGLKSFGHPIGASGLRMIYEVYKQIQGKAQTPERQLKKADMGLTHNLGGFPGRFTSAVSIIGRHD